MNRDEAMKQSEEALGELTNALREGKSEMLIQYLEAMSRFHQYSFSNCMLIYLQKPNATLVAGFRRWKELHRWVKIGEKGISILAPMIGKRKKSVENDGKETEGEGKVVYGFRTVHIFDVSQTEGKELPNFAALSGEPGELQQRLEELIRRNGIELQFVDSLNGANGVSRGGRIEIVAGLDPAQKFSTSVHELAHEWLHRDDRRDSTTKTIRETEAEAVAYAVCRWAGIDCSTRAADYIQLYSGNDKILMQSLELIRDVAARIIQGLAPAKECSPKREVAHAN